MRKSVFLALVAVVSTQASAQEPAGITLFAKGRFAGQSVTLSGPTSKMVPFNVQSLKVSPGTTWDLCSGNTFSGCERFSESRTSMVRTVRSVRPVAGPILQGSPRASNSAMPSAGLSLGGFDSEYFVMPAKDGARVEVAPKAEGAQFGAATRFCRSRGWRASAYERVQPVGDRTFLADVLCVNQDR